MLSHIRNKRQAPPKKVGQGPKGAPAKNGVSAKNVGKGVRKVAGPQGKTCNLFLLKAKTLPKRVHCSYFYE